MSKEQLQEALEQLPRQHQVNPLTDRCVMCGRNGFARGLGPKCPGPNPQQAAPSEEKGK